MKKAGTALRLLFRTAAVSAFLLCCGRQPGVPETVRPRIVRTMVHDTAAFTQGLFYANGRLYESDGLYERSSMRMLDAATGAILKSVPLPPRFFGEGCAALGSGVVQITWQEQTAFVYSLDSLVPGEPLTYSGEGWGLTGDGTRFYMSDGSDTISVRSKDFAVTGKIPVTMEGRPVKNLNELEFVRGKIYANVWYSKEILEIDPKSGCVRRIIDCSELVSRERPSTAGCVLNGIAWDPRSGLFYLTGKKWKTIFVAEIPG